MAKRTNRLTGSDGACSSLPRGAPARRFSASAAPAGKDAPAVKAYSVWTALAAGIVWIGSMALLGGCGHGYEWQAQTRSLPLSSPMNPLVLHQEPIAVLETLTSFPERGMRHGFTSALDRALSESVPQPVTVMPSHHVLSQLNAAGLAADYEELVVAYERSGVLDRARLQRIGATCRVNYVFQPVYSTFSQETDNRFSLLGWRLFQTRTTVLRLGLELWDVRTGSVVWASSGEVTIASDGMGQARIPLDHTAEILWSAMLQDLEEGRIDSTYTHTGKAMKSLNPFSRKRKPTVSDTEPSPDGAAS